jgi:hypothetical protein
MTTRKSWPLLLALAFIANVVLAAGPLAGGAHACSCAASWSSEEALRKSDAVFSGEVVKIGKLQPEYVRSTKPATPHLDPVTFDVGEAWKGIAGRSAVVHGQGPAPSCGLNFERDETYLVFAYRLEENGPLQADYCGNTFAASEETARNILGPPPTRTLPETGDAAPDPARNAAAPVYAVPAAILSLAVVGALFGGRAARGR